MTEFRTHQQNQLTEIREQHLAVQTIDTHFPAQVCSWMGNRYSQAWIPLQFVVVGGMSTFDTVFATREEVDALVKTYEIEFDLTFHWEGDTIVWDIPGAAEGGDRIEPQHAIINGVDTLVWPLEGGWCWNSIRWDLDRGARSHQG